MIARPNPVPALTARVYAVPTHSKILGMGCRASRRDSTVQVASHLEVSIACDLNRRRNPSVLVYRTRCLADLPRFFPCRTPKCREQKPAYHSLRSEG